eukprot:7388001-Prymnesium_polylepis.1
MSESGRITTAKAECYSLTTLTNPSTSPSLREAMQPPTRQLCNVYIASSKGSNAVGLLPTTLQVTSAPPPLHCLPYRGQCTVGETDRETTGWQSAARSRTLSLPFPGARPP